MPCAWRSVHLHAVPPSPLLAWLARAGDQDAPRHAAHALRARGELRPPLGQFGLLHGRHRAELSSGGTSSWKQRLRLVESADRWRSSLHDHPLRARKRGHRRSIARGRWVGHTIGSATPQVVWKQAVKYSSQHAHAELPRGTLGDFGLVQPGVAAIANYGVQRCLAAIQTEAQRSLGARYTGS